MWEKDENNIFICLNCRYLDEEEIKQITNKHTHFSTQSTHQLRLRYSTTLPAYCETFSLFLFIEQFRFIFLVELSLNCICCLLNLFMSLNLRIMCPFCDFSINKLTWFYCCHFVINKLSFSLCFSRVFITFFY